MLAAGEIDLKEFRRLSNFPDLEQSDQLANALEERVLHDLDAIVEDGAKGYSPPDEFILDASDLASTLAIQTINKYAVTDLEEEKMDLLRAYWTDVQVLKAKAMAEAQAQTAMAAPAPGAPPAAAPQAPQTPVAPPQASVSPTSNAQV